MQAIKALLNEKLFSQTSPVSDRRNYLVKPLCPHTSGLCEVAEMGFHFFLQNEVITIG